MEHRFLDTYEQKDLGLMLRDRGAEMPAMRVELVAPSTPAPVQPPGNGGLREYLDIFRRRALAILVIAACCGFLGYLVTLPQRPVYRAETALEIQSPSENFLNLKDFDPGSGSSAESYVEAQVKVLRGEELLDRAASRLGLGQRPELWRAASLLSAWKTRLGFARRESSAALAREEMLAGLKDGLTVRTAPQSRIVDVQFESTDPQVAAGFANELAGQWIDHNLESRLQSTGRTAQALAGSMREMKSSLEKSANELQSYAGATGLILDQDGGTASDEKLRQVQAELSRAQADRAAKQSRYEVAAAAAPESLPDVLDYGPLRDTQARFTELKRQHAELSSTFSPTYFKVKNLAAQIAEMERLLQKEQTNILQRIYNEYQSALRREKLLAGSYDEQTKVVSRQASASVHYNTLKRDVETNRMLYDAMLQKVKEAGIATAVRASNIRIINRATAPSQPYRPKPLTNAATGLAAGFFLATAFVLIRDQTDRTIRYPGEAAEHLNVTELGAIPSGGSGLDGLAMTAGRKRRWRSRVVPGPAEWVRSGSRLAESFRSVLASLWYIGRTRERMRVFVVTSPNSRDGKSTVVSHLGVTMAHANRRVLLIDGDLRRPGLHGLFGVDNRRGLAGVLADTRPVESYSFEELFQPTEVPELFVLPGGSGVSNVAGLRFHDRLIDLLARARMEFDVVLMDTPPAIEYADARILGGLADGVILVLRAARTTRNAAWVTVRRFQDDGALVAGTILNDWSFKDGRYNFGVVSVPTAVRRLAR